MDRMVSLAAGAQAGMDSKAGSMDGLQAPPPGGNTASPSSSWYSMLSRGGHKPTTNVHSRGGMAVQSHGHTTRHGAWTRSLRLPHSRSKELVQPGKGVRGAHTVAPAWAGRWRPQPQAQPVGHRLQLRPQSLHGWALREG